MSTLYLLLFIPDAFEMYWFPGAFPGEPSSPSVSEQNMGAAAVHAARGRGHANGHSGVSGK